MRAIAVLAALACGVFPLCAVAQVAPAPEAAGVAVPSADTAAQPPPAVVPAAEPCTDCITIPALTVVTVEIMVDLGSKISKSGDTFPIRLAAPIIVDGREVVPVGTMGMGEVVHAKKSGGSGAAGELVLAARYLDVDGRRLQLRSMKVAVNGRSNVNTVNTINIASAASPLPIGIVGFIIKGKQANVPAGTVADAKTAESFSLAPPPVVASAPVPAPVASIQAPAGATVQNLHVEGDKQ